MVNLNSRSVHDILYSETTQDSLTILSILESLLVMISRRWPHIKKVVLQSDNASCYASNMLIGESPSHTAMRCAHYAFTIVAVDVSVLMFDSWVATAVASYRRQGYEVCSQ